MIDLMKRLAELCPEWCEQHMMRCGRWTIAIRLAIGRSCYLDPDDIDIDNAPALLAIVERMVDAGWEVSSTSHKQKDGSFSHACDAYRLLGEEICSGYFPTFTEAVLRTAVAAFEEEAKE